jgi:hypothetical protein
MKTLIKIALLSILLSTVYGCASSSEKFEVRLPPPDAFNPIFLRYKEMPGQKVMVVAIDPTGQWAFGYDENRETLEEAARSAAMKCDKEREKHKVFAKARLFAVNDEIVYYNQK